jgi:hypothetical protein
MAMSSGQSQSAVVRIWHARDRMQAQQLKRRRGGVGKAPHLIMGRFRDRAKARYGAVLADIETRTARIEPLRQRARESHYVRHWRKRVQNSDALRLIASSSSARTPQRALLRYPAYQRHVAEHGTLISAPQNFQEPDSDTSAGVSTVIR